MNPRTPLALLAAVAAVTAWSLWKPADLATWFLETGPLLAAIPLLWATWRRFPLTALAYVCIALHGVVLLYGAHSTYAETPLGNWARDAFGFQRNHYDRLGHLAQGFFPAIVAREVLVRTSPLRPGAWLFFLVFCVSITVAAVYELAEWAVAVLGPEAQGVAFLGTQGDVWDTQWDILLCGIGCVAAQLLLARFHDRQIAALPPPRPAASMEVTQ
jgi:putative membrane protein